MGSIDLTAFAGKGLPEELPSRAPSSAVETVDHVMFALGADGAAEDNRRHSPGKAAFATQFDRRDRQMNDAFGDAIEIELLDRILAEWE